MKYSVDLPYPEIRVEKPNIEYAKYLSNIYAGEFSEESSINLYIFQHITLLDTFKEYSKILRDIAIVEMHHLEILGELINLLGMQPVFMSYDKENNILIPWRSSYLKYNADIIDIISLDIRAEENAIKIYKELLNSIDDKYVNKIIERIILDEELHLCIFKKFKSIYEKDKDNKKSYD